MKTKYNNIIEWIIIIILAAPFLILLALKYVLKVVERLVKAAQAIVKCSLSYMITLHKDLVEALRVKD